MHPLLELGVAELDERGAAVQCSKVNDKDINRRRHSRWDHRGAQQILGYEGLTDPYGSHERGLRCGARHADALPEAWVHRAWIGGIVRRKHVMAPPENWDYAIPRRNTGVGGKTGTGQEVSAVQRRGGAGAGG